MARRTSKTSRAPRVEALRHPEAEAVSRPAAGVQADYRATDAKQQYRYDSSLAPCMEWDDNPAREQGDALIQAILSAGSLEEAKAAAGKLKAMGRPFLDWAGKFERQAFGVETLPLFLHERLSTQAIIEALRGHLREGLQQELFDLYGDPRHSIADQCLKAYQHREPWANRLILGDNLQVMNSLLHKERMAGQVQMVYMDPPYGVKFGSNFQPFVRKRDVKHGDDDDLTREPETVQAYRDTWELGLHSYLTYLRDRLLLVRELLHASGSVFVQISDENVHHVRELMDEVFGADNFISQVNFQTTTGFETATLSTLGDYLLWYAKNRELVKVRKLYRAKDLVIGDVGMNWLLLSDGRSRGITAEEKRGEAQLPEGARLYGPDNLLGQGASSEPQPFEYEGKVYTPSPNAHWKANYPNGMQALAGAGRLHVAANSLRYRRFATDFSFSELGNIWTDTSTGSFTTERLSHKGFQAAIW